MIKSISSLVCAVLLLNGCATTLESTSAIRSDSASTAVTSAVQTNWDAPVNLESSLSAASSESNTVELLEVVSEIESLTVEEALRLAEANRPDLEALKYRIGMSEGEAQQAGLWPNPTVSLGFEGYSSNGESRPADLTALDNMATLANRVRASTLPGLPSLGLSRELWIPGIPEPRHPDQLQQVVSIAQPLPIWGTPRLARNAGLLEVERWRREYERAKVELQTEVRKTFDAVVFHQERLAATLDLERTLGEILDVTRVRLDAGEIAEVELIKGQADHERFALEVEATRAELHGAKSQLSRVLGDPSLSIRSCAADAVSELPALAEETLAQLREDHPQVKVWRAAEDAAEAELEVAASRRLPVPTLGIGYRHYEFTDQDTLDVSLEFELPFFDRRQGEIRAVRDKARFEAASHVAEKNGMEAALAQAIAEFTSHRRQAESMQERILPKMEESLSIERARFEAGEITMLEVLDAYRSLVEVRLAHLHEVYAARSAYHDLEYLLPED